MVTDRVIERFQQYVIYVLLLPARICPFFFQRGAPESVVGRMANDSLAV